MPLIAADPEIFIQIAAYRDPELPVTVADCIARAAQPDRLTFGICWQHGEDESIDDLLTDPRIRVIAVDAKRARGPCWARNQLQHLYDGEEYTLQIDSHHRFADGWDEFLIDTLESLRSSDCPRPALTSYAPHYDPEAGVGENGEVPLQLSFDRFGSNGVLYIKPEFIDDHEQLDGPIPARFYSAHYCFADGRFTVDVPHDPGLYFHGEEPTMSVRAFTHGYDLFHPHRTVLWHQYTRSSAAKHWEDDPKWNALNALSFRRQRQMLGIEEGGSAPGEDPFGLGTVRTVEEYEDYAGLDLANHLVQEHTRRSLLPPNPPVSEDNAWLPGVMDPYTYTICLEPEDLPAEDDVDFWYVGAHDDSGIEIDRQDLEADDLAELLAAPPYRRTMRFEAATGPSTWTVWPHSKGQGWLERITRPVAAASDQESGSADLLRSARAVDSAGG